MTELSIQTIAYIFIIIEKSISILLKILRFRK